MFKGEKLMWSLFLPLQVPLGLNTWPYAMAAMLVQIVPIVLKLPFEDNFYVNNGAFWFLFCFVGQPLVGLLYLKDIMGP
jgi:hypothetical protein